MIPYVVVAGAAWAIAMPAQAVHRVFRKGREERRFPIAWNPFEFALVALLVAFSGFRYQVGSDFPLYTLLYTRLDPNASWWDQLAQSETEFGYTLLSLWLKTMFESPAAIFWAAAVLTVVPAYLAIRKQTKDLPFAILLYVLLAFYVSPFNIVRQGIAIALNFWAYSFLGKRNWAFVLINIVAALFHTSAIVAAVAQLGVRLWKPRATSTVVVLAGAVAFAGAAFALPWVNNIASLLSSRYENYIANAERGGVGTYLVAGAYLLILILVFTMRKYVDRTDWLAMLIVAVALQIAGAQVVVAARLFYYFAIFVVLLLPNLLAERKTTLAQKVLVTAGAAGYFLAYLTNFGQLVPYQTYP